MQALDPTRLPGCDCDCASRGPDPTQLPELRLGSPPGCGCEGAVEPLWPPRTNPVDAQLRERLARQPEDPARNGQPMPNFAERTERTDDPRHRPGPAFDDRGPPASSGVDAALPGDMDLFRIPPQGDLADDLWGALSPCERMAIPCLEDTDYENTICVQLYGPAPAVDPNGPCAGARIFPTYPLVQWPEVACLPPCVIHRACLFPSEAERQAAAAAVPTVVLTEASQVAKNAPGDWTGWQLYPPGQGLTDRQQVLIDGALALLRANTDLLAWAICLAGKMSRQGFVSGTGPPPLPADSDRGDPPPYPQHLTDSGIDTLARLVVDRVEGDRYPQDYVYVIRYWEEPTTIVVDLGNAVQRYEVILPKGTTGAATNVLSIVENGGEGPILPMEHALWLRYADQVHDALQSAPPDDASALCAVTELCTVLIHEWVHRYMDPFMPLAPGAEGKQAGASDSWSCWAMQKMAANTFRWGIHQRYACTTALSASQCPRPGDGTFNLAEWVT